MKSHSIIRILIFNLLSLFLVSCSLERRIGKDYIRNFSDVRIQVNLPDFIHKLNLKHDSIQPFGHPDFNDIDSSILINKSYLSLIDESIFLNLCERSLKSELVSLGFNLQVFTDSVSIIQNADKFYTLDIVQMQLEETSFLGAPEDFNYLWGSRVYGSDLNTARIGDHYFDKPLNAINLNAWFELSEKLQNNYRFPVLYSTQSLYDEIVSDIYEEDYMFQYTVKYDTEVHRINVSQLYGMAILAGKRYAGHLFDYLLNLHIQEHMPKGWIPKYYYHYDQETKWLTIWNGESFFEIDP